MRFTEFTPQMLDFLAENHIRNSKAWYDEHKQQCRETVIKPYHELVKCMTPVMLEIDPLFETTPYKCTARVRRDNRYTKNKDLYRDHLWITFRHPKTGLGSSLCYYFEIMQDSWGYGVGYYDMKRPVLDECTSMILHEDILFLNAYKAIKNTDFELYGDEYKRVRFPEAKEEYQPWLQKKQIGADFRSYDFDLLFQGEFYDKMIYNIKAVQPFYALLQTAQQRAGANSHREGTD